MATTDEAQREIQRLQQALDSETGNRINLGQRLSVANKRIDQLMVANSTVEGRLAQARDEARRLRDALELIAMHGCLCSPERRIDSEERECASCIAHMALGRGDPGGPDEDGADA